MIVTINATDITSAIELPSFRIEQVLTKEVDTFTFKMLNPSPVPVLLQEVEVKDDDGDTIFGGVVINIARKPRRLDSEYEVTCKDYSELMDGQYVVEVYENETVNDIIADIKTKYLPASITINNVDCGQMISYVAFNYMKPSQCLTRLAELALADWSIDYAKDIHFFIKSAETAPFNITDNNNKCIADTLEIKANADQIKNTVYVRGGEYIGASYTENKVADGDQTTFVLSYKYDSLTVTVDGTSKTVGVDFIDDPATKDCLYNFEMKTLKFPNASKPTAGQLVAITGKPYIPVYIKAEEPESIATYGVKEFKIIDNTIKSINGAKDRARAELQTYKDSLNDGKFTTYEKGLAVGQRINIQSTILGVSEYFIINRLTIVPENSTQLKYTAGLVSAVSYDMIELLQRLLDKTEVGEDRAGEVLEKIKNVIENVQITESITRETAETDSATVTISVDERRDPLGPNVEPIWVLAPYVPSSITDTKREGLLNRSLRVYAPPGIGGMVVGSTFTVA